MTATKKKPGNTKKTRKSEKKTLRQYVNLASSTAKQVPITVLHYSDVAVWQPYKAYWRWGQKLSTEPREALTDLAGYGQKAASGISRGTAWGITTVRHYGEKIPGLKSAGQMIANGIRAVPARLKLVGSEDIQKLNLAVDKLSRKLDALAGKVSG
jgi:hypothetical protein